MYKSVVFWVWKREDHGRFSKRRVFGSHARLEHIVSELLSVLVGHGATGERHEKTCHEFRTSLGCIHGYPCCHAVAATQVLTMSLPVDEYESLRQRICPEQNVLPEPLALQFSGKNWPSFRHTCTSQLFKCNHCISSQTEWARVFSSVLRTGEMSKFLRSWGSWLGSASKSTPTKRLGKPARANSQSHPIN